MEENAINTAIQNATAQLKQIQEEMQAIPMMFENIRKPVPDQGVVLILTALGDAHFEAILKLDETVLEIERHWLGRAISNETREALIHRGRQALDRVYEASYQGYLRVSAVYNRVRHQLQERGEFLR
jgi:tRNA(Glu) U13 pseudouridine synthase TruD